MKLVLLLTAFLAAASVSFAEQYLAEGYFVVDNKAVENYMRLMPGSRTQAINEVKKDLDYMFVEVNEMLATLKPDIDIQMRVRGIRILNTNIFLSSDFASHEVVNPDSAIRRAAVWLLNENAYNQYKFDFSIFYTGYEMHEATGIAYNGGVCDNVTAVGVVQATMTYSQAMNTARELAHILGSPVDGPTSDYLGSKSLGPMSQHRWSFSDCSSTWIRDLANSLNTNCLTQTNPSSITPSTTHASYSGDLFDPDKLCKRALNDVNSYVCLGNSLYNGAPASGDGICKEIYCSIPGTDTCRGVAPADGSVCGSRQRCNDGQCRTDHSAPSSVNTDCIWGEQEHLDFHKVPFSGTCSQFINKYDNDECYTPAIRQICCDTCKCNGPPGCECGDKSSQCVNLPKSQVCPQYGSDLCCGYCQGYVGKRSIRGFESSDVNITVESIQEDDVYVAVDPIRRIIYYIVVD